MTTTIDRAISRKIISQASTTTLSVEDVWKDYQECINDQIDELESKWDNIDDAVWSKIIVMERSRRIAKIVLRKPNILITSGCDGYDSTGGVIGLKGFENLQRDNGTKVAMESLGQGIKIGLDEGANILVTKMNEENLYCKVLEGDIEILEENKPFKLFDMKKFQMLTKKELKTEAPNWIRLRENIATTLNFDFLEDAGESLDQPLWIIVINVVALDFLRSKQTAFIKAFSCPVNNSSLHSTIKFNPKHELGSHQTHESEKNDHEHTDLRVCVGSVLEDIETNLDEIDDDVWARVIIMEKNVEVAKMLLRKPIVVVTNGDEGFDGNCLVGLGGFENPSRDKDSLDSLKSVGKGCRLGMDTAGNILVDKLSSRSIFARQYNQDTIESLDIKKPYKLFDMKRFQKLTKKELKKDFPNWLKIQEYCVTTMSFIESRKEPLEQPLWMIVVNIVALGKITIILMFRSMISQCSLLVLDCLRTMQDSFTSMKSNTSITTISSKSSLHDDKERNM